MIILWGLLCIIIEYVLLCFWIAKIELPKHSINSKILWCVLRDIESHKDVKIQLKSLDINILIYMAVVGIVASIFIGAGISSDPPGRWIGIAIGVYSIWFLNRKFIWERYSDYLRQWVSDLSINIIMES